MVMRSELVGTKQRLHSCFRGRAAGTSPLKQEANIMRLFDRPLRLLTTAAIASLVAASGAAAVFGQSAPLVGTAAFGDWRADSPGVVRLIRPGDLPRPGATASSSNTSHVVTRPAACMPPVLPGFKIELFASGLRSPRQIRVAPNGDIFVAETRAGRIRVLRADTKAGQASTEEIYASSLNAPFGIAFFPAGDNPQWLYVANTDRVVRFRYASGDLKAPDKGETVAELPHGYGHSTRDIVFTKD